MHSASLETPMDVCGCVGGWLLAVRTSIAGEHMSLRTLRQPKPENKRFLIAHSSYGANGYDVISFIGTL
jgi:hypothetical protein